MEKTNLIIQRGAGGETVAQPGDPGAELEPLVLEPDFRLVK